MTDVQVSFSLEEAKALNAPVQGVSEYKVWSVAKRKLEAAIRVVELREGDEQLEMKVAEVIRATVAVRRTSYITAARAAIAAVEEHREGKK